MAAARDIFEPTAQRWISASVWEWLDLPPGYSVQGPAVIEHPETTVYVGASQTAVVDKAGNLLIELTQTQP
jgi:N-methylhydantoinase A